MSNHVAKVTQKCAGLLRFLTGPLKWIKILCLHLASNVLQIRDQCFSCGVQEIL